MVSRPLLSATDSPWFIACLCAAWCDTCQQYQSAFTLLQEQHADKFFAWIDIEDRAFLVEDLDVENFPTILIQYESRLVFLGTMLPDIQLLHRLIQSYEEQLRSAHSSGLAIHIQANNQNWLKTQPEWNLRDKYIQNYHRPTSPSRA